MLDAEKISYFETEKQEKSLGTIFLDEIIETRPETDNDYQNDEKDKKEKKEKKGYPFYIQVPGRRLLLRSGDEDTVLPEYFRSLTIR